MLFPISFYRRQAMSRTTIFALCVSLLALSLPPAKGQDDLDKKEKAVEGGFSPTDRDATCRWIIKKLYEFDQERNRVRSNSALLRELNNKYRREILAGFVANMQTEVQTDSKTIDLFAEAAAKKVKWRFKVHGVTAIRKRDYIAMPIYVGHPEIKNGLKYGQILKDPGVSFMIYFFKFDDGNRPPIGYGLIPLETAVPGVGKKLLEGSIVIVEGEIERIAWNYSDRNFRALVRFKSGYKVSLP
jgi:hypothetical protein